MISYIYIYVHTTKLMLFSGYIYIYINAKIAMVFHRSDSHFKHDDGRRCASLLLDVLGDSLYVPWTQGTVDEMQ